MPIIPRRFPPLNRLSNSSYLSRTITRSIQGRRFMPSKLKNFMNRIFLRNLSSSNGSSKAVMAELQNGNQESRQEAEKELRKEETAPATINQAKATSQPKKEEEPPKLPALSAGDFKAYNYMAEHMEYFHNSFRRTWTLLHNACVSNKRPSNLTLRQFIQTGLQFIHHLETHHSIEETYVFPRLAARMPEFKNTAELLRQHREIHAGMDGMEKYLNECKSGERELELRVLKERMDSWGGVLWKHLDEEVRTLGAENMRRYWTKEEVARMMM